MSKFTDDNDTDDDVDEKPRILRYDTSQTVTRRASRKNTLFVLFRY